MEKRDAQSDAVGSKDGGNLRADLVEETPRRGKEMMQHPKVRGQEVGDEGDVVGDGEEGDVGGGNGGGASR